MVAHSFHNGDKAYIIDNVRFLREVIVLRVTRDLCVIRYIDKMGLDNYRYSYNNRNLIVFTTDNIDKKVIKIDDNSYMFSKRTNCYEIRKLSNTRNANVIFSVNLKPKVLGISNQDFIKELLK